MASSFQIGSDLSPYLAKLAAQTLVDIFEPKGSRIQRQQQEALAKLAEYAPKVSKLPEEDKKQFYNKFFRAYGVYHPPFIRQLFGAGQEPILPLPEGSRVEQKYAKGPLGLFGRSQTSFHIPQPEPFKFSREEPDLLLHPKRMEELKQLGFTPADIKRFVSRQPTEQELVMEAYKVYGDAKAGGASEEEALQKLGPLRPIFESFKTEKEWKKAQSEEALRLKQEVVDIKKEEQKRKERETTARERIANEKLALLREREARMERNAKRAESISDQKKLYEAAYKTYIADRNDAYRRARLELEKWHKARAMGENYIMVDIEFPSSFEEWLRDEGSVFGEKLFGFESKQTPTPESKKAGEPPIRKGETSTIRDDLLKKYGITK